mgnify:CR=1 FL=1|jgi:hypothetical protein
MRSNLLNLIHTAARHDVAHASGGKWRAYFTGQGVDVWHHSTHMITVHLNGNDTWGRVEPINHGHGSTSDRCGVRRITTGAGVGIGYRELYGE